MFVNTESYKESIRNEKREHLYGNTGTTTLFAVDSSVSLVGCFLGFFLGLVLGRQQYLMRERKRMYLGAEDVVVDLIYDGLDVILDSSALSK